MRVECVLGGAQHLKCAESTKTAARDGVEWLQWVNADSEVMILNQLTSVCMNVPELDVYANEINYLSRESAG